MPYTFVTYKVTKVMQGSAGRSLTLRFAGGADGRGGFVDVTGVPTFEVGDDDILFVKGNGSDGCPAGRMRVRSLPRPERRRPRSPRHARGERQERPADRPWRDARRLRDLQLPGARPSRP